MKREKYSGSWVMKTREAALVGIELEILGHDRVYEEAVLAAGEMLKTF